MLVHRQGEGAPYTGLKSEKPKAVITAADLALDRGSLEALEKALVDETTHGPRDRFETLKAEKAHADHTVEAGRRYVAAYVDFMHYAETLHQVAAQKHDDAAPAAVHVPSLFRWSEQHRSRRLGDGTTEVTG